MTGQPSRRGLLVILSSPSGAGKSTLARRLRDWDPAIRFSVSATTRPPRASCRCLSRLAASTPAQTTSPTDRNSPGSNSVAWRAADHFWTAVQTEAFEAPVTPAIRQLAATNLEVARQFVAPLLPRGFTSLR